MYMTQVLVQHYSPAAGMQQNLLDPTAVSVNFQSIEKELMETKQIFGLLDSRLKELEAVISYTKEFHPHVLAEFATREAAKERIV